MKFSLNGEWKFKQAEKNEWYPAQVPGCNYLDLLSNNLIIDPFYGTNEKEVYWVSEKDWEYTRKFSLTEDILSSEKINLVCECLDTICDVFVNGNLVGKGENHHICYKFDIKPYAQQENEIKIRFYSPVEYVLNKQKHETTPANCNGLNGIPHIRKPQCHFGWDWGPVLTPSGISGDICVEGLNVATINSILINQTHNDGKVNLAISTSIDNFDKTEIECKVSILSPSGKLIFENKSACTDKATANCEIETPELWWIRDISGTEKQPLYTVKVEILANGKSLSEQSKRIGLRTIKLNQDVDKFGKNFQFVLNGASVFAKGANWIPSDTFVNRTSKEKLEYYIKSAADCNFNMIRVWGGGYYESEEFYDLCDEYGIIVWQDFAFACQPYPFFMEDFRENVLKEVEYQVQRLRHHASLGLWCGNNEIELMAIAWKLRTNYVAWTKKFFWDILPEAVSRFDKVTPYIAGTPVGIEHDNGFSNDNVGDTHLWAVWHGLKPMNYYRKRMTRFCSEFGFESLPDIKTIETYAKPEDYSLTSEVFKNHQKCASGNMKMAFYIASRFRLPQKFEDYIYLSQICEQECIRDATEHWRRNKGRCNGSLFWQYNDCWPVCSWSSVDYYGNFKALQYTSKHFFAPIMLSIEDSKKDIDLYVINDTLEELKDTSCKVVCSLYDFDGKLLYEESSDYTIPANSSKHIQNIKINFLKGKCANLKNCVFVADLLLDGKVVSHKTFLFDKERNLKLPQSNITFNVEVENGVAKITLTADKFARLVRVHSKTITKPFSDNYFDILAGEKKVVTLQVGDIDAEQIKNDLLVSSVCDVVPKGSKLSDNLFRIKVFMIPINFGNWIYYSSIPKNVKV